LSEHSKFKSNNLNMVPTNLVIINEKDDYLYHTGKEATQLYLLAKSNNLEIIKQSIAANKIFHLWSEEDLFEFYYLLEGEIINLSRQEVLTSGTYITVRNLTNEVYFKTTTHCTLLLITNHPIFEEQQKHINKLLAIKRKVEEKDKTTDDHNIRLQRLSCRTGEELNIKGRELFVLEYASILHDIGKSEIPVSILQKPGKLTNEEWDIIRKHPEWGRDLILHNLKRSFFEEVAEVVYQHHERYDGKGYPQNLKHDEILIQAQIISVVDSYDAMISNRPYQKALTREAVLQEILKNRGTQFAPEVVDAFLKVEEEDNNGDHEEEA